MRPWIHRLVQQLSLPLGLSDLPAPSVRAPSRAPAARAVVPASAVPGVNCPPAISRRRAAAAAPTRPASTPLPAVQGGPSRRALRLHLDPRHGAQAVMSGRCADVCAMLDRLAAQEAAACHAG